MIKQDKSHGNIVTKTIVIRCVIAFFIALVFTEAVVYFKVKGEIAENKSNSVNMSQQMFQKLTSEISAVDGKITSMVGFCVGEYGTVTDFEKAAETVMTLPYVTSVTLAPSGSVAYVYPNDDTRLGYNFNDNNNTANIGITDDKYRSQTVIGGPFLMKNNRVDMYIRIPVYVDNGGDSDEFWGYASANMDFSIVLNYVGINELSLQQYRYKIYRSDEFSSGMILLNKNDDNFKRQIFVENKIYNQTWCAELEPEAGWYNKTSAYLFAIGMVLVSIGFGIIIFDYHNIKLSRKELARMVVTDALTNVYTRRYFHDCVIESIQDNRRFAICYVDVDSFKDVNDNYGHDVGDGLLVAIADRMRENIGVQDFIARIGGDEFVIYLSDIHSEKDAWGFIKRMRAVMSQPYEINGIHMKNAVSAGLQSIHRMEIMKRSSLKRQMIICIQ